MTLLIPAFPCQTPPDAEIREAAKNHSLSTRAIVEMYLSRGMTHADLAKITKADARAEDLV